VDLLAYARQRWRTRRHRRLFKDGALLWQHIARDKPAVLKALYERFPRAPRSYVEAYLESLVRDHAGNPKAPLYLDAELGAWERQHQLVADLERRQGPLEGRSCLDVGCSNGSLLLAAREAGASRLVGVDVSATRLASARLLCAGTAIDLRLLDFVAQALPEDLGCFDVVFCTDVLEHVHSVPHAFSGLKQALAAGADSYVYVSLFNGRHPSCVRSEPHYGVPGLVLLEPGDAREVWLGVRSGLSSRLDYEVHEWPEYGALKALAGQRSLRLEPLEDREAILGTRGTFWRDYARRAEDLGRGVEEDLARLAMPARHRDLIQARFQEYARTWREAHQAFAEAEPRLPEEAVVDFYMTWYAQPLRFLLRHDDK
jgi:2-polyprenyl-3-methyl-5-hydroxy-6-metoxy-1,4-benzoquinol methylase